MEMIQAEVERHFRPEFLNRVDELVVFNQLTREDMSRIVRIELAKVEERLAAKHLSLDVDQDVLDLLIDKSFSQNFGARPLKRAIERYLEDPLSEEILRGELDEPHLIHAILKDDEIHFDKEPVPETEAATEDEAPEETVEKKKSQ